MKSAKLEEVRMKLGIAPDQFYAMSILEVAERLADAKPSPLKLSFMVTCEIDPGWVNYLTQSGDIFGRQYAGYWLRGVLHDPVLGWLCWEDDEEHYNGKEPGHEEAAAAWLEDKPLPKGWYRLDETAALKAWEEGVKRWGVNWYEHTDGPREDVVVQLALLGEVRYG